MLDSAEYISPLPNELSTSTAFSLLVKLIGVNKGRRVTFEIL